MTPATEPQERDPLAMADEVFRSLGGAATEPEQGLFGVIEEAEAAHPKNYTAELVVKHRPQQARRALFLLASNWGINRTAKATGLGTHTVIALRNRYPEMVATARERLASLCDDAALLQVERLIENPDAVKLDNAAMTAKLLRDTSAQLRGDALPVQRHIHATLTAEDLREMAAGMGLVTGGNPALPAVALAGQSEQLSDRLGESVSLALQRDDAHVTTYAHSTTPAGGEGVAPAGQGGGFIDASPAS